MYVAIMEVGPDPHVMAVRFANRDTADAWADKNNAEIVGWAPLLTLGEARTLAAHLPQEPCATCGETDHTSAEHVGSLDHIPTDLPDDMEGPEQWRSIP